MKITPERFLEILSYDADTGYITKMSNSRVLTPDESGCVVIHDNISGASVKMKYSKLAYLLAYRKYLKDNQRILHKNLDVMDCSLQNLTVVSREVFLKVKEAKRNLDTGIKLLPHKTDQFCYNVHWFDQGTYKSKMVRDVVLAKKLVLRLKLKYSKVLTTYCVFD